MNDVRRDGRPIGKGGSKTRSRIMVRLYEEIQFCESWQSLKIQAIMKDLGLTASTFYLYWPSLEACFWDLLKALRVAEREIPALAQLLVTKRVFAVWKFLVSWEQKGDPNAVRLFASVSGLEVEAVDDCEHVWEYRYNQDSNSTERFCLLCPVKEAMSEGSEVRGGN